MQINPLKRAELLYQILNILELLLIHSGICNEQDTPVDISGILKSIPDISFCNMLEIAHHQAVNRHPAPFQNKNRMKQQRIAKDLYTF